MSKIDSWVTKVPRLKNSKVARFSYKAEAYANDNIEGVDSYDYSRDMNVPLATHTDFDASVLSIGARTSFSSVPKNGLNHFFGRVSYNLNKVIDFLSDFLDDFRVQGVETVSSSVAMTLPAYYSGKKLRLVNTHATNSIQITFYAGQTFKGSSTVIIPANTILELELIGTTWLHVSDFTESPPTPWAQYSGKDIPQLPDNVAGTTYKRDNDWTSTDGWAVGAGGTISIVSSRLQVVLASTDCWIAKSFNFSGSLNRQIQLCVTPVSVNRTIQLLYSTSGHGYSYSYVKNIVVLANKNCVVVDMGTLNVGGTDWISSTITGIRLDFLGTTGDDYTAGSLYIGSGAYDRLVFDNSYHYRHLLNNAVVPTPQGLYFNGKTSYLRSKEKITLPDVFTFSATVNCAKTANYQRLLNIYNSPTSRLYVYTRPNTNNLVVEFYNPTTSSAAYIGIPNFFIDNIDIDTKIEIDFVNKTIKFYKNNVLFNNITVTGIQKPTDGYLYIGSENGISNVLLGYMRNICLFDTALTDTQRNWLAQGNTPPILYDVTNYETEGYVSIQDADGTNTGEETDVDSNGNRILKLPSTIKANVTGIASANAPTSHASSATTYGVSSEANYGHAKASTVAGSANGVASKGSTPTVFAQSNHVHPLQTSVSGNAGTADKWKTARNITISDADGTNTGTAVVVDGSENETLKLPATIKANVTGIASANAPTSHASAATTYGVSSEANYGHAKASNVAPSANGVASKGSTPTVFAQSNHVHPYEIETLRRSANFTLETYADGKKIRIANTHATNTITVTMPSGQTILELASIPLGAGLIVELELIGTDWKSVSETVLEKYGTKTNGYTRYSSGKLVQRVSYYDISKPAEWIEVTYPIAFSSNAVVITANLTEYYGGRDKTAYTGGATKTTARVYYPVTDSVLLVEAVGCWK